MTTAPAESRVQGAHSGGFNSRPPPIDAFVRASAGPCCRLGTAKTARSTTMHSAPRMQSESPTAVNKARHIRLPLCFQWLLSTTVANGYDLENSSTLWKPGLQRFGVAGSRSNDCHCRFYRSRRPHRLHAMGERKPNCRRGEVGKRHKRPSKNNLCLWPRVNLFLLDNRIKNWWL